MSDRFSTFAKKSQLDTEDLVLLKPLQPPPLTPPSAPSVAQLRRVASAFRKAPTSTERWLWSQLRGKQLTWRFRRQYVVAGYIVDFYCPAFKLVVEIDGPFHHNRAGKQRSNVRDGELFAAGIKQILHFDEEMPVSEMFRQIEDVLRGKSTARNPKLPQSFPPRGERDPQLHELLNERNPKLAELIAELAGRKRMA